MEKTERLNTQLYVYFINPQITLILPSCWILVILGQNSKGGAGSCFSVVVLPQIMGSLVQGSDWEKAIGF